MEGGPDERFQVRRIGCAKGTEIAFLNFRFVASAEIPPDCLARGGHGPGVNLASAGVFFIAWFRQQLGHLSDAGRNFLASSFVMSFAAARRPGSLSK
jgi:hypothetical protein